jgi:hypothetical protein
VFRPQPCCVGISSNLTQQGQGATAEAEGPEQDQAEPDVRKGDTLELSSEMETRGGRGERVACPHTARHEQVRLEFEQDDSMPKIECAASRKGHREMCNMGTYQIASTVVLDRELIDLKIFGRSLLKKEKRILRR